MRKSTEKLSISKSSIELSGDGKKFNTPAKWFEKQPSSEIYNKKFSSIQQKIYQI